MMMMNHFVSLEIDHDSAESTLSNSPESALLIGDAESRMDDCVDWTNEKHNSYLHSLENSFVRQLNSLLGGQTRRFSRTRDVVRSSSRKSTNQLRVVRNTCLHKVNKRAHLGTTSLEFHFRKKSLRNNLESISGNFNMGSDVLCKEEMENVGESDSEVTTKRKREANFDDSSLNDQVVP